MSDANNNALLKGWIWHIPFYPCIYGNVRTLKEIFWYDSSQEDGFTRCIDAYEILVPESLLIAQPNAIKYVRENKEKYISNRDYIIVTDNNGNWGLRPNILPVRLRIE